MPEIWEIDMYDLQKLCDDYGLDVDVLEADLSDIRKDLISAGWDDRNFFEIGIALDFHSDARSFDELLENHMDDIRGAIETALKAPKETIYEA